MSCGGPLGHPRSSRGSATRSALAPVATSAARLEPRRSRRDLLRSELGRQAHSHPTTTGLSCGGPSGHPRSSRGSALSVGAPRRTTNSAARLEPRRSRRDLLKYTPAGGRIREPTTDESPRPLGRGLSNTPDRIRTCDLRLRRATLYPAELRARAGSGTRTTRTARNKPSSVRRERREDHFSRTGIAAGLQQPLAPGGVCRATSVTSGPVRSYRTLSPLPVLRRRSHRRCALCGTFRHRFAFPLADARALPGTLPCGARTFLRRRHEGPPAILTRAVSRRRKVNPMRLWGKGLWPLSRRRGAALPRRLERDPVCLRCDGSAASTSSPFNVPWTSCDRRTACCFC